MSRFPQWQIYVLLNIDDSPILGTWKPKSQSQENSFEAKKMSFILPMSLGNFLFGHHRIVTYGKQKYSFVPHSHASLHFLCLLYLLFFWFLLRPFFLNFIQAPLSIVSFCVREEFTFHLTDREELLAIWDSCFLSFALIWIVSF